MEQRGFCKMGRLVMSRKHCTCNAITLQWNLKYWSPCELFSNKTQAGLLVGGCVEIGVVFSKTKSAFSRITLLLDEQCTCHALVKSMICKGRSPLGLLLADNVIRNTNMEGQKVNDPPYFLSYKFTMALADFWSMKAYWPSRVQLIWLISDIFRWVYPRLYGWFQIWLIMNGWFLIFLGGFALECMVGLNNETKPMECSGSWEKVEQHTTVRTY